LRAECYLVRIPKVGSPEELSKKRQGQKRKVGVFFAL
jgi:hypothetical protein